MRRFLLASSLLAVAAAAFAANPFYLDHSGVLWNASSTANGLLLTATKDATEVVHSVVPFPIAIAGSNDAQIQVVADDLTGKVMVVWQRNWSESASEIMLAVWRGGTWERIEHLSHDLGAYPRNPTTLLTVASTTVPDPEHPEDATLATVVTDSFLHVLWWQGVSGMAQSAQYALLRLTGDPSDPTDLTLTDLDTHAGPTVACDTPPAESTLEHPLFASQSAPDQAVLLFASPRNCMTHLLQVGFALDPTIPVVSQRRRHTPIFGVRKEFPLIQDLSMEGARVILGANLKPVVYRVVGGNTLEYVMATDTGWTPLRNLVASDGLTLDQAIPLVENLVR